MRRAALLTTIIVALSGPAAAQDNATVQKLADQFTEAFNKNSAAGVGDLYAEEAILMPPGADMRMGRKDIQAFWTQQVKRAEGLSIAVLDVKPLGPDAARAVVRGEMTTKGDEPRHLTGRNVVVLQKVGVDWKIAAHIWNYGAGSGPIQTERRESYDRGSRNGSDRDRLRERLEGDRDDRFSRERGEARRHWDDNVDERRFGRRGRGYDGRHSSGRGDGFRPRYGDSYED